MRELLRLGACTLLVFSCVTHASVEIKVPSRHDHDDHRYASFGDEVGSVSVPNVGIRSDDVHIFLPATHPLADPNVTPGEVYAGISSLHRRNQDLTEGPSQCNPEKVPTVVKSSVEVTQWSHGIGVYFTTFWTSHALIIIIRRYVNVFGVEKHEKSLLFKSINGGASWTAVYGVKDNISFSRIHMSRDKENILLPFIKTNQEVGLLMSKDGFKTITTPATAAGKHFIYAEFNQQDPERILAMTTDYELYQSSTYGMDWAHVYDDVYDFAWGDHTDPNVEVEDTMYLTVRTDTQFIMLRTDDFMKHYTVISNGTKYFHIYDNHIFAFTGNQNSELSMKISSDGGGHFQPAVFDMPTKKGLVRPTHMFNVVTVDAEDRMLVVVRGESTDGEQKKASMFGTLYIGDAMSKQFTPVMQGMFIAFAGFDDKEKPVFENQIVDISSCAATFIAFHVEDGLKKTVISKDFGLTWHRILEEGTREPLGVAGDLVANVFFDTKAKGVILINAYFEKDQTQKALFASHDAGKTWDKVLPGTFFVKSLDGGSIFTAVNRLEKTSTMAYSYEEGRKGTWTKSSFTEQPLLLNILIAENGQSGKRVVMFGASPAATNGPHAFPGTVYNFEDILPLCTEADYERTETGCVLGRDLLQYRRKMESCCYNAFNTHTDALVNKKCPCASDDFECDLGYGKDGSSADCKRLNQTKTSRDFTCGSGARSAFVPTGYKKVSGVVCEGGVSLGPTHKTACPGFEAESAKGKNVTHVVIPVMITIACLGAAGIVAFIVYRARNSASGSTYMSIQADEWQLKDSEVESWD